MKIWFNRPKQQQQNPSVEHGARLVYKVDSMWRLLEARNLAVAGPGVTLKVPHVPFSVQNSMCVLEQF